MTRDDIFNSLLELDESGETVLGFVALENISKLSSYEFESKAREIIEKYFIDVENALRVDEGIKLVPINKTNVSRRKNDAN